MNIRCFLPLLLLVTPALLQAKAIVVKEVLSGDMGGKQVLTNGDLEKLQDGQIAEVNPWDKGYEVDQTVARSGKVSARITITDPAAGEHGLTYPVTLNQQAPVPFTAELWSRAQDVSGTPDNNYSLYIDLTYMDGTPLWGQVSAFAVGTHEWQKRTVTVVPEKPVREVSFHAIFRHHTGTAWFDDFALRVLELPAGAGMFDGVPIKRGERSPVVPVSSTGEVVTVPGSLPLRLDAKWGFWLMNGRNGGLFVRDATRKSDFRQPTGEVTKDGKFTATDETLGLKLTASIAAGDGGVIAVDGWIEDLTGQDRGVSVYCALPMPADSWHDDMRASRPVRDGQSYSFLTSIGCGANGKASLYPFGCVTAGAQTTVLGAPLDPPFLYRFAYDAASQELYGVEDLGLTKDSRTPGKAPFRFILYRPQSPGFRGALADYYQAFPEAFRKRTTVEGNWMAFDDIAGVQHPEDFHFAFKEGTNNAAFDEAHGILTYTYVEPMSYWMAMGSRPRTPAEAMKLLAEQAAAKQAQAMATMTSAVRHPDGSLQMSIEDAPWCDGALFINNPAPNIPTTPELSVNQNMVQWRSINNALGEQQAEASIGGWNAWDSGYQAAPGAGRNGSQAAVVHRPQPGPGQGLSQTVPIRQEQPGKITVSAWCKAEGVTGEEDKDFSIYCDLTLAGGTPSWGHSAPFSIGTHDWEHKTVTIDLPQPVVTMSLHLLFRGNHTGQAWFDDVSVTVAGRDGNLVQNPGLEPKAVRQARIDGTYIDSLEMSANLLDFDRAHWRVAQAPLVFTTQEGLPAQLLMFATYEFIKGVSEQMHAQDRTIFANAALHRFAQPAGVLDVMGTETNWRWQGKWSPMNDATCNFKRALCYQKPYLLLQNTVFEEFPVELVEKYMARSIFYGLFPSFFSHNASERTYWTRPEIYNRDRHLFQKYLPVAKAISAAGWEPLTHATTGNEKVYVERWGRGETVYFTLFNDSDQPQPVKLSLDLKSLGLKQTPQLRDVLADKPFTAGEPLAPEALLVLQVMR